MAKKSDQPDLTDEAQPQAEIAEPKLAQSDPLGEWEEVVMLWAEKSNLFEVANVLKSELALIGITSVDQLSKASVQKVSGAVRAALKSDAQALLSAAHKLGGS